MNWFIHIHTGGESSGVEGAAIIGPFRSEDDASAEIYGFVSGHALEVDSDELRDTVPKLIAEDENGERIIFTVLQPCKDISEPFSL